MAFLFNNINSELMSRYEFVRSESLDDLNSD